ncbi:uncharacterized protein ACMZJ9_009876 [Mantella aurantiaca]
MENNKMIEQIGVFSLDDGDRGNQGYRRVLLQLFGYMGHGKSSFINSCKYVLNGGRQFVEYAEAGQSRDGGSVTLIRKAYHLTAKITMVDNRGFRAMSDFERCEVYAQLGNFYPLNQVVEWKEDFNKAMAAIEEGERNQNFTDFLVPIFIYSARYTLGEEEKKDVKSFLENCVKMTAVFPIIVITHKNSGYYLHVEREFKLLGAEEIISLENYTRENHSRTWERDAGILKVIDSALRNVTFRLDQPRDPKREQNERKEFLRNYLRIAVEKAERERGQYNYRGEQGNENFFQYLGNILREKMCVIL